MAPNNGVVLERDETRNEALREQDVLLDPSTSKDEECCNGVPATELNRMAVFRESRVTASRQYENPARVGKGSQAIAAWILGSREHLGD